jgi:CheY-like chemotaxis protein
LTLAYSASDQPFAQSRAHPIVEDEPFVALMLQPMVEDAGGDLVGAVGTASAALTLVQSNAIAAAILDVHLSDRDVSPVAEVLVSKAFR